MTWPASMPRRGVVTGLSLVHEVRAKLLMKSLRFHNWKRALGMTGTSTEIRDLCERLRGKCLPQAPSLKTHGIGGPCPVPGAAQGCSWDRDHGPRVVHGGEQLWCHRVWGDPLPPTGCSSHGPEASRALSLPALPNTWPLPGMRLFPELQQLSWQSLCATE